MNHIEDGMVRGRLRDDVACIRSGTRPHRALSAVADDIEALLYIVGRYKLARAALLDQLDKIYPPPTVEEKPE